MDFTNLLKKPTVQEFYNQHKDEILKLVATENLKRVEIANLTYQITALSGKRYYSFPERMAIPFQRIAKGLEMMQWLENGISPGDFDRIRSEMVTSLAHIRAKKDADKHMISLGLLIDEMNRRRATALPYYVLVNLVATYMIREDEDPSIINPKIHHEKCDDLERELEQGNNAFFLQIPQLRKLSEITNMSLTELKEYLQELKKEEEQESQKVKALISWIGQRPGEPTSSKAL